MILLYNMYFLTKHNYLVFPRYPKYNIFVNVVIYVKKRVKKQRKWKVTRK